MSRDGDGVSAQLRHRREASYRCPPLGDGRRDPLDSWQPYVPLRRRLHASVTLDSARGLVLIRGFVLDTLRFHGLKPLYSAAGKGWVLDGHHTADVVAMLEVDGFNVRYKELAA